MFNQVGNDQSEYPVQKYQTGDIVLLRGEKFGVDTVALITNVRKPYNRYLYDTRLNDRSTFTAIDQDIALVVAQNR